MSTPQLVTSYVEMIPPRARGALYFSGVLLPLVVGYLVLRGWAGQPEQWFASGWSGITNAIAVSQVVAGNVARRRQPPPRDETGSARLPEPRDAAVVAALAVLVVILAGALAHALLP